MAWKSSKSDLFTVLRIRCYSFKLYDKEGERFVIEY